MRRGGVAGLLLIAACSTASAAPAVTLADDASHRAAWTDGRHDASYTEWWYFNFHDPRTGVWAIFSYFVTNPGDAGGLGRAQMVAVAGTPDGVVTAIDTYPPAAFSASGERADVTIDPGVTGAGVAGADLDTVRVAPDGRYIINGASGADGAGGADGTSGADGVTGATGASGGAGRVRWSLAYSAEAAPWLAADPMPVGRLAWEQMSWLVFMPRARVAGTLSVDGREYVVDAPGYHDHNWGEWIPTDALWNWAQFSTPRVAIEVGDFIGKPIGIVSVDLDGERTVFTHDQYTLVHTRWAWDAVNGLLYPVESLLTADNGSLRVQVTLRAIDTAPLRGDLPAPLRDLIIYEQTARYSGAVWERAPGAAADGPGAAPVASAGEWRPRALLAGTGFKEYTAKHY